MNLWSEQNFHLSDITFVPMHLKHDFLEHIETEIITPANETIFYISDNCLSDVDLNFLGSIIISKIGNCNINNLICFLEKETNLYNFSICKFKLEHSEKSTPLLAKYYNSMKEVYFILGDMLSKLLLESPFQFQDSELIWLDNELSIFEFLNDSDSFNYLDSCFIQKTVKTNIEKLRLFTFKYSNSKPFEKLAILSSWFLFSAVVTSGRGDNTKAILLLHRALETCFKSWLLSDRQINLDKKGEIVGDNHTYLVGYMDMVIKERSLSDSQISIVKELNEVRNKSKYAHGFISQTEEKFNHLCTEVTALLFEDMYIHASFKDIEEAFKLPLSLCELTFNFLLNDCYVECYKN
jgi:hypothetical protein